MNSLKIQVRQLICLSLILGGLVSLSACMTDVRMREADVRQVSGGACFAVGATGSYSDNSAPLLAALEVYDTSVVPAKIVWSFAFPAGGQRPLSSDVCIPYGVVPVGASASDRAEALKLGRVYEVYINARFESPANPTFGFVKKFCLNGESDGTAKVVKVEYIDDKGWDLLACR